MFASQSLRTRTAAATCLIAILAFSAASAPSQAGSDKLAYKPAVSIRAEVFLANGTTVRTYSTPQGLSYWTGDLPVLRGDKVKIDVFALTGGAELDQVKIRLDTVKAAELKALPWTSTIDTSTLSVGYHMVEAWVQSTGDHPQSNTGTLTFYVTDEIAPRYIPRDSQATAVGGNTIPAANSASDIMPELPAFIKGQSQNDDAGIVVRSTSPDVDAALRQGNTQISISQPTLFYVEARPGSSATQYAYVFSRDGKAVVAATEPVKLRFHRIRIQSRTDTTPGLRVGPVSMWVWGIDKDGHPSSPVKVQLNVLEGTQ